MATVVVVGGGIAGLAAAWELSARPGVEVTALEAGDKQEAGAALQRVQPELARGVARGVIHKNTASRKFSRLTKRFVALG